MKVIPKEKVNYQEVYDLYQLCCETKDLKEFCSGYGVQVRTELSRDPSNTARVYMFMSKSRL